MAGVASGAHTITNSYPTIPPSLWAAVVLGAGDSRHLLDMLLVNSWSCLHVCSRDLENLHIIISLYAWAPERLSFWIGRYVCCNQTNQSNLYLWSIDQRFVCLSPQPSNTAMPSPRTLTAMELPIQVVTRPMLHTTVLLVTATLSDNSYHDHQV